MRANMCVSVCVFVQCMWFIVIKVLCVFFAPLGLELVKHWAAADVTTFLV